MPIGVAVASASKIVARFCPSVRDIRRDDWDRLLPGHGADWAYFAAAGSAPPPGFELGAIVAESGGRTIGVAPTFTTVYRFDTALQGPSTMSLRKVGDFLFRHVPQVVSMKVLSLGAPMCDDSHIGIAPELDAGARDAVLRAMLDALQAQARTTGCKLIAAKGLGNDEAASFEPVFAESGYTRVTTIPNVVLDLPFDSLEGYLASLPEGTAAYLRRKWRSANRVRIEHRENIDDVEDEINEMFSATLAQSKVDYGDFSRVHQKYFATVLRELGPRARLILCWVDDELLSFQLYVVGEHEVLAKGIGMKYPKAREFNLYFLNWREMIGYCLEHGKSRISMSGTTYGTKLLMGGQLDRRWIFFRFTGRSMNAALPWLAPAFDYETNDPELKSIRERASGQPAAPTPQRGA